MVQGHYESLNRKNDERMNAIPYCDTGEVFEADTIANVWKREDKEWLKKDSK